MGGPVQRTRLDALNELKHLAKVRVAGSNPVFRSNEAGQGLLSTSPLRPQRLLTSLHVSVAHEAVALGVRPYSREPLLDLCGPRAVAKWCRVQVRSNQMK